jgi:RNA polymerase sigma-70 factor, ECF subfamily
MVVAAQVSLRPLAPQRYLRGVRDRDGELLCRIAARDGDAFEALYRRYARPVFALALRMLRDRGRAEDAVQEAFAAVWRSARTYRPERGPGAPWLYAIARNAVVDCTHGRRDTVTQVPDQVAPEPGPEAAAEASWLVFRVHAAVAELPERERAVLELAYWGGRSQSEIARFLGIPLGTVKTRTRAGLTRMAAILEGQL